MKNLNWMEVALVAVLVLGAIAAQVWAPGLVSILAGLIVPVITWILKGPGSGGGAPPTGLAVSALCLGLFACDVFGVNEREATTDYAAAVNHCMEEGRKAPDGGHLAAYEACKKDAGL